MLWFIYSPIKIQQVVVYLFHHLKKLPHDIYAPLRLGCSFTLFFLHRQTPTILIPFHQPCQTSAMNLLQ